MTSAASLALVVCVLEVLLRTTDAVGLAPKNFIAAQLSLFASAYPSSYDELLGYVPRPSYDGTDNVWGQRVSIDATSLRRNGRGRDTPQRVDILAVGDSFTFGDEVSDEATWPAQLETISGRTVANGGVFGYGLDQTLLRTERLVPRLRPTDVVLSFVYDDVRRTEFVKRTGVEKPYFALHGDALVLRNVPPSPQRPRLERLGLARTVLGHSYLLDWVMRRGGLKMWWYAGGFPQVRVHSDGLAVSCRLMERLRLLAESGRVAVLVVAQYSHYNFTHPKTALSVGDFAGTAEVLACARSVGLATLDTLPELRQQQKADPRSFAEYFRNEHMSATGNASIARLIAGRLSAGAPTAAP